MENPSVLPSPLLAPARATALRALGAGLVAVLLLASCGDDSNSEESDSEDAAGNAEADGSSDDASQSDTANGESDGEVPDPCSLISNAELSSILGSDPGTGESSAVVPDERKACMYDSGLIIGIEVASHFETSIGNAENEFGAPTEEISGLGQTAKWWDFEMVGSLWVLGDDYSLDIHLAEGQDAAQAIAEGLLAAL